jgi:hypothetical protein
MKKEFYLPMRTYPDTYEEIYLPMRAHPDTYEEKHH